MINEKKQADELPEPIDIKMDVPPDTETKKKKDNKKDETVQTKKETVEELIEKNIKWSKAIYAQNKKIKSRLNMMVFLNYFKILLIVAPIILAIVYLPTLIGRYLPQFENLFSASASGGNFSQALIESFGLENIIPNLDLEQIQQIQGSVQKK